MNKIRILTITRSPINSNDNLGSTLEMLLGNNNNIELHNVYLRSEEYNNNVCSSVYQIPEQLLLKSFFRGIDVGNEINIVPKKINYDTSNSREKRIYGFAKKFNLYSFWLIRELVWFIGRWKNDNFKHYLEKVKPDIIFFVSFNSWYTYNVLNFIKKNNNSKLVVYHVDDNYSINRFNISPFYWFYKHKLRRLICGISKKADLNYCISDMQKEKYERLFNIKCSLLQKTACFGDMSNKIISYPLKIVFTGNISSGRWETLSLLGKTLDALNSKQEKAYLEIYTQTQLTKKMKKYLSCSSIRKIEPAFSDDIPAIQKSADILVHVESFKRKYINDVKFSFSTKIVDYLSRCKAILAIGPVCDASINYFLKNNIGIPITNISELPNRLSTLIDDLSFIKRNALESFLVAKNMHDLSIVSAKLVNDLRKICSSNRE